MEIKTYENYTAAKNAAEIEELETGKKYGIQAERSFDFDRVMFNTVYRIVEIKEPRRPDIGIIGQYGIAGGRE